MSNSGPAPCWNRNAGFGCQDSGPGVWNMVRAVSGVPMSPRSMIRRAVCSPAPRNVSGAQPSRTPAASAVFSSPSPDSRSSENGFSVQTCLPAFDGGRGHLHVRGRDGQVDDDLDVGMVQCRVHAARLRDAVFLGPRLGRFLEEVGDDVDLQVREDRQVVQVLLADVAGADDGDADRSAAG